MHVNEIPAQAEFVLLCSKARRVLCQQVKLDAEVSELVLSRVFCLPAFCTVTQY